MSELNAAASNLSVPYSRGILAFVTVSVPGFFEALPHDTDPRAVLAEMIANYLSNSQDDTKPERQAAVQTLLESVGTGMTKRFTGVSDEIRSIVGPMCAEYMAVMSERTKERAAAFEKRTDKYRDLGAFIMSLARERPPRLSQMTAAGLVLGFGLAASTGNHEAANAAAYRARQMLAPRLIAVRAVAQQDPRKRTVNEDPFFPEQQEGVAFLERMVGSKTNGARLGYRGLDEPESFDHIVQSEIAKGTHGEPTAPETKADTEAYVSRRVGYVLDTVLTVR